jgi:hypothetical protein
VLAVSPDGTRVVAGDQDGRIFLADLTPEDWDADKAKRSGAKELEQAWADLASKEAAAAYRALWTLSTASDGGLKVLKEQLRPVKVDVARVRKLAADLDARRFALRDGAFKELQRMGFDAEPELRNLVKEELSAEAKKRVEELLSGLDTQTLAPEAARSLRAVVVLERMRTPEARALLEHLTTGEAEARLTREARLALKRWAK